ncbi:MAG: UDP-N-acetylglucosamine--N-acetylmuramyl-(pentapeptide) pyrophosphoryl-undecaprenol [Actinomycetota bacterium]|jgi:UDP-N-acetylglucosamine--N-acetylmuramyl-(pentapeptide) pyrophosphoryl-undecaprenol N-acetylglucosamine transferase
MATHGPGTPRAPSIVIAAGGTGGHIYPGLALADAISDARPDAAVHFVGTSKGMEGTLVPKAGHTLDLYDMVQFNGQGWRKALVPAVLLRGSLQARRILRGRHADVAVSMGGYSGVPLVLGARFARVPSIIHEPGAVPGQANVFASRFTKNIATAFPQTRFSGRDVHYVGYPLRGSMTSFDRDARRGRARAALGLDDRTVLMLVVGGSQGALSLNLLTLGLAERWADRDDVRFLLKPGTRTHAQIAQQLATNPGRHLVELVEHIDDMEDAYAAADIGICRSGAGTVTELAIVGLPSILVPLPAHEHDEQLHNAQSLVDAGGAIVVRDHDATPDVVGPILEERLADRSLLHAMSTNLQLAARPHADADLAAWVLEIAEAS